MPTVIPLYGGRLQLEGVRQGLYIRVVLKRIPVEFINNFDPCKPVVIGKSCGVFNTSSMMP